MAVTKQSMSRAVVGASKWKTLREYAANTGRVSFSLIADSNGLHTDFGWTRGLARAIRSSGIPCFGTGLLGSRHSRLKYVAGGGQEWAFSRYTQASAISGTATTKTKVGIELTNINTSGTTVTVASGTDFTNYSWHSGDRMIIINSSGALVGDFTIASRTDATHVELTASPGTLTGASATVTGAAGASSNSTVPSAYARRNNIPQNWLPFGNAMVYHTGGTCFAVSSFFMPIYGPIPLNGQLTHSSIMAKSSAGKAGLLEIYGATAQIADTAAGTFTAALQTTAYSVSGGSDGDLVVARNGFSTDADRTANTTYNNREYLMCCQGNATGDSGTGANLYMHATNANLNRGFALNAFMCRGGMSAYDMAEAARFLDTLTWEAYIYAVADQHAAGAGGDGTVRHCFIINTGFNDASESATSYDATNSSSTKAGHKANVQDLMATIRARWNTYRGANADRTELYFMLMPSHCISDAPTTPGTANRHAQEASVRLYRQAQAEIAGGTYNTFFVDLQKLWGTEAYSILNNSRFTYTKDSDVLHLMPGGYDFLAAGAITALNSAAYGHSFLGMETL